MNDPVALLTGLVRAESVSGREEPALAVLADWFAERGIETRILGRNLVAEIGDADGPVLLLNGHVDTVPVAPGWTRDPFGAEIEGDRLFGLGANDNKASVAGLACAVADLADRPPPGRIVFAATCDEETGGEGLEWLRPRLPAIDQAVITEPTDFRVAIAQRGLVRLTARAVGKSAHASRPWEGENAIALAVEDVRRLLAIPLEGEHPLLGRATLEITKIEIGPRDCVHPALGRLDLRVRDRRVRLVRGKEASSWSDREGRELVVQPEEALRDVGRTIGVQHHDGSGATDYE